jgi:hypothetical protein
MAGWPTDEAVKKARRALHEEAMGVGVGFLPDADARNTEAVIALDDVARIAVTAAGLPALVSHAEVRAILGTRNPRLPAGTPAPLYENVGGRSLWLRDDIETFAIEFRQRPNVIARRQS